MGCFKRKHHMKTNRSGPASPVQHPSAKDATSPAAPSSSKPSAPRPVAGALEALAPRNGLASMQRSILSAVAATAASLEQFSLPNKQQQTPSVLAPEVRAAAIASDAPRLSPQKKAALGDVLQRWLRASNKKSEIRTLTPSDLPPGSEQKDIQANTGNWIRDVIIRKDPRTPGVYPIHPS